MKTSKKIESIVQMQSEMDRKESLFSSSINPDIDGKIDSDIQIGQII